MQIDVSITRRKNFSRLDEAWMDYDRAVSFFIVASKVHMKIFFFQAKKTLIILISTLYYMLPQMELFMVGNHYMMWRLSRVQ